MQDSTNADKVLAALEHAIQDAVLSEDEREAKLALMAQDLAFVITDMDEAMRRDVKYEENGHYGSEWRG